VEAISAQQHTVRLNRCQGCNVGTGAAESARTCHLSMLRPRESPAWRRFPRIAVCQSTALTLRPASSLDPETAHALKARVTRYSVSARIVEECAGSCVSSGPGSVCGVRWLLLSPDHEKRVVYGTGCGRYRCSGSVCDPRSGVPAMLRFRQRAAQGTDAGAVRRIESAAVRDQHHTRGCQPRWQRHGLPPRQEVRVECVAARRVRRAKPPAVADHRLRRGASAPVRCTRAKHALESNTCHRV